MAKKHLLWIVPLAVLVFALFPQSTSWEDEVGYGHPFPGFWVHTYETDVSEEFPYHVTGRLVSYRGQMVALGHYAECYSQSGIAGDCHGTFVIHMGWKPQTGDETLVFFLAGSQGQTDIEWVFSPAYGDNPEDGLVGIHFLSFRFVDGISESWKWYEMTRLFLVGEVVGDSFGCNGLYFTRGLDDDYLRLGTGCPVYPGEGLG